MSLQHLKLPIEGGKFYHIYKRSSIAGPIFYSTGNYQFFLRKMDLIIGEMVDMAAFCLMPDHFHFLFRAREVIMVKDEYVEHPIEIGHFISEGLRKLFTVYSNNIIKQEGIVDPVLDSNFSRIEIADEEMVKTMVKYVHFNCQMHGETADFHSYPHSSYLLFCGKSKSLVDRDTVFALFGNQQGFIEAHQFSEPIIIPDHFALE